MEADDVQIVLEADVERERSGARPFAERKLVDGVVEVLCAATPTGYPFQGATAYSFTWTRPSAIGVAPMRRESRSVPPPPMNSTRA